MKQKIFLFNATLLIYLASLTVANGQSPVDRLPNGAIARFSPGALVYTVAFSPDGKLLASGGDDNAVILWNIADRSERETFIEHSKSVTSVAFSPDGKLLASTSLDGYVRLWHVSSEGRRISLRHGGWVESVAFSPDGKTLVSGGEDQESSVKLWDVPQKRDIATFSGHESIVESVAFSPDGQLIASASRDKTIKLWDVADQQLHKTLSGHSSVVHDIAFSFDGELLASSSRDNSIKLWKVSSGENLATFEIQNNLYVYAEAIAFSPNGKLLASACVDYTVKLWDVVNHREVKTLPGHHGGVTSVAFSPDGRMLASGSRDRTVLLWDLAHFGFEMPDSPEAENQENAPIVDLPKEPEPPVSESEDIIPPDIVIHLPIERIVNSTVRQILVKVNVTDDSRIDEVWINKLQAMVLETGEFRATISLNHGKNEIRVTATDAYGNMGTHQFIIKKIEKTDDLTLPQIAIRSPTSDHVRLATEQFTIQGNVTDDKGVNEIRVNGTETMFSVDGTFTKTVQLLEGENLIRVTAIDTSGNINTNQFTIVRDTTGPTISIDSPASSADRGFQPPNILPTESILVSGTVNDPSGIATVKVQDIEAQVIGDRFETTVSLVDENNLIRVTATDTLGNQAFEDITYLSTLLPDPPPRKDYALLFAVNTYDHWPGLRYPLVDAINIGQDLKDIYGFQVELIQNPTKTDILRVLHKYAQKEYTPEDQLLIFFAGHGDFDTNMGYLVSRDTKKPEDDSLRTSYFSHSYFRDFIDRMPCKHIFLVMDTCYSGTFDERLAMRGEEEGVFSSLSQADVARKWTYTTRWYLTSGANEKVPDDSLFARALLEALRSEGGRDNILTIREILTYFEELSNPKPCFGEFGRNAPGSDFLFITTE
ncbi:MAG: caspase family protein [Candidatus Poribacteria bacterium]|nr:caspase family protein [Candidatus Poribacteria bacterium]